MLTWDAIEGAFGRLMEGVRANPALAEELARSRLEFFASLDAVGSDAERRHREWFLLERPSQTLSGVPAESLAEDWAGGNAELSTALLHSLPGVFAVTSLVPGEGLWVHDLATQGEHPVVESDASTELQPDDVLVGRMFPVGGGLFRLSPAMAWFRSAKLVRALRADFEQQRTARRGVLRIAQLELERLFHGAEAVPGAVAASPRAGPASDLEQVRRASREGLSALGLDDEVVQRVLQRLRREARQGLPRAVTDVLNGLAFDTDVDLTTAQRILVDLWQAERAAAHASVAASERELGDAQAALASFDRGRAEGQDLEKLFRKLERDLGVDADDDEDDDEVVPDFPGVVGAMVEEFLWDVERERDPETAQRWSVLRRLGEYGRDIGLFDELAPAHLLDFSGRWLLDEAGIGSEQEVTALLEALEGFCRWCEDSHALPLWTGFGPRLGKLAQELPRLVALRRELADGAARPGAFRVVRVEPDAAVLADRAQEELRVAITPAQRRHLRDGDVVRVTGPAAAPAIAAAYPGELLELIS